MGWGGRLATHPTEKKHRGLRGLYPHSRRPRARLARGGGVTLRSHAAERFAVCARSRANHDDVRRCHNGCRHNNRKSSERECRNGQSRVGARQREGKHERADDWCQSDQ
jgi:hypothetical protein